MASNKSWASDDLWFLSQPACNPDMADEEVQRKGNMRPSYIQALQKSQQTIHETNIQDAEDAKNYEEKVSRRQLFGRLVNSVEVQIIVTFAILFDATLTMMAIVVDDIRENNDLLLTVGEWIALVVLSVDVLGRLVFHGLPFFSSRLNQFELFLVPASIVEILTLRHLNIPVPFLRLLRPCFRASQFLRILVRTLHEGRVYWKVLRHHFSGDRVRFTESGLDLDLAYITPQIVAMSVPAVGFESMVHNRASDVARFLNERHGNKYLLVNTTEERQYGLEQFFYRYLDFPIGLSGVPTIETLEHFCKVAHQFLAADSQHVLVVHSKHGQGRVGLVVCSILLHEGHFTAVSTAIAFFEHRRKDPVCSDAGSTETHYSASQRRFLEYFALRCSSQHQAAPQARKVRLRRIRIFGMKNPNSLHISCFGHPDGGILPCSTEAMQSPAERQDCLEVDEQVEEQTLLDKLHQVVEECQYDSRLFGSLPMQGQPLLSSFQTDSKHHLIRLKEEKKKSIKESRSSAVDVSLHLAKDTIAMLSTGTAALDAMPVVWEVFDTELQGEIRFEVHCYTSSSFSNSNDEASKAAPDEITAIQAASRSMSRSMSKQLSKQLPWWMKVAVCCGRRRQKLTPSTQKLKEKLDKKLNMLTPKREPPFQGMVFACWLHTDYLEYNEAPIDALIRHTQGQEKIIVDLHRFDMDKGSNAPTLRSHSSALKVQLEFDIDPHEKKAGTRNRAGSADNIEDRFVTRVEEVSGSYDLGWLSFCVKHLWPYAENAIAKLLHDTVQPELQQQLPPPFNCVQFSDFKLGSNSPELGPIVATAREHEGFGIQLDLWVRYSSDIKIAMDVGIASIGINHISLKGLLSVTLDPISNEIPVLNGIKLFFLNPPEIDIQFTGQLEIANFAILRKAILDAIHAALLEFLITPNMMVINWSPETLELGDRVVLFQDALPNSVLRLGVIEATDLPGSDFNLSGQRTSDPYAEVRIGSQRKSTAVIYENVNPVWNAEFDFLVHDDRQHVNISVYDEDLAKSDLLGKVKQLPISRIIAAGPAGLWVSLCSPHNEMRNDGAGQKGRIRLTAREYDLLADPEKINQFIYSSSSKDSVQLRKESFSKTEVKFTPANQNEASKQEASDENPVDDVDAVVNVNVNEVVEEHIGPVHRDGWGCSTLKSLSCNCNPTSESKESEPAVAMLVCQLVAGRLPSELGKSTSVELRVGLGQAKGSRRCTELLHPDLQNVPDRVVEIIARLAMEGFDTERIADIVKERVSVVQRVIRKTLDWNLEMLQRLCVLLEPCDLRKAAEVTIEVLVSGKEVGVHTVPVSSILEDEDAHWRNVLHIPCSKMDQFLKIELDLDIKIFALVERTQVENCLSTAERGVMVSL